MINIIDKAFEPYKIELVEKFNKKALYEHIYSGFCGKSPNDLSYPNNLLRYLKHSKDGKIGITYNVREIGRLKPVYSNGEKAYCQMRHWCNTKYEICKDLYYDVDIVNCQPVLLQQLMKQHNMSTKYIRIYNKKREEILQIIMDTNKCDRHGAKSLVYKIMFSSDKQLKKLLKKYNNFPNNPHLFNYITQIKRNRRKLLKIYPQMEAFYRAERKRKANDGALLKPFNAEGGPFAYLAQHCERIALISMYEYFTSKGFKVGALIHDGLHLEKDPKVHRLLKWCEKFVLKNTGFKVSIKIKPFELRDKYTNVVRFNALQAVNKMGINIQHINSRFLTKRGKNDHNGFQLANKLKLNEVSLIISITGSGKTEMIKKIKKLYPGYDILSIVSRRTLSDMHETEFKIKNYQRIYNHSTNEVFQVDSIDKVPTELNSKYIMVMDETASMSGHLLNRMKKMSQNRLLFVKRLSELINHKNCKMVIGMDSNMNDGTVKFIKDISNKPINLYINDHKIESDIPVTVFNNKNTLLRKLIECIKAGEKVYVCSNMNADFKREVYEIIKKECQITDKQHLLYSSNDGEMYINTRQWKKKQCIFCTPSVVYGCDSNNGFHVFGFYYNARHFDAMDINQQLNRERKPESINIYMANVTQKPFSSVDQAIEDGTTKMTINRDVRDSLDRYEKALKGLFFYEEYRRSYHLNIKHHVLDLLRKKGYTNVKFNTIESEPIEKQERGDYILKLIDQYHNGKLSTKMTEDLLSKFEVFGLNVEAEDDETYNYFEEIIKNNIDIFIDRKKYRQLLCYRMYKYDKFNKLKQLQKANKKQIKEKFEIIGTNYDIIEIMIRSNSTKLYLLDRIRRKLKIQKFQFDIQKTVNKKNYNDKLKLKRLDVVAINKAFRIRGDNKIKGSMTRLKLTQFYMTKMNSLLGSIVDRKRKNKRIGDVKYDINTFNIENLKRFDGLLNIKPQYRNKVNLFEFDD